MNREVEERIVAMYFDNKDFEKNAKTTIDTLGQLKEGLNIEESASKGFEVFKKIGKTLDFSKTNQQLTNMKSKLSSMGGLLGKVFKIGKAPLDEAKSAVNTLNGYITKYIGFNLASKIVGSVENALRSLTIQPISAGWNQYESKMDSVKTIMSSTGEDIETVEKYLSEMTEYANKTIYSLTDMTSNLGKFTNNGIELSRATKAMEGIANATADAGQGAQQASMAMYNISQAMGVGKMTTIDWKSLENANIATQKLKNTFLEMAAASGKLAKETKEVNGEMKTSYWLEYDEDGKKLKERIELTAANFREYLSKGWLDKETMLRTFEIYGSGGVLDDDTLESWGIKTQEERDALKKLARDAMESATQVRTFSKMMDALRESVQSGWANSFEIIFGNMEEGTQLWTRINDKLDGILSKSSERRNEILKGWAEMTETGEKYWTLDEQGNTIRTGVEGGRDILINTFFQIMDVVQEFSGMVSKAFENVFGKIDSKTLFNLTTKFRDFVQKIKDWLGTTDDAKSRLSKLQRILQGFFGIIKAGINIVKTVIGFVKRLAAPVIDWLIDNLAVVGDFFAGFGKLNFGQMVAKIGEGISKLWTKFKSLFVAKEGEAQSPIGKWISGVWDGIKKAVRELANNLGLGGVLDAITSAWDAVTGWQGWADIGSFFSNIWGWISQRAENIWNWFTMSEDGKDSGFVTFLKDVASEISRIWGIIVGWEGWQEIGKFFGDIWTWISEQATAVWNWFTMSENGEDTGFVKFLKDVAATISSVWNTVTNWSGWEDIGNFFGDIWTWISEKAIAVWNWFTMSEDGTDTGFVKFLKDVWATIQSTWEEIKAWPLWGNIGAFLSNTWGWIQAQFTPTRYADENGHILSNQKAPIVGWLEGIWNGIKSVWNKIVSWEGWQSIGNFFSNTWNWIVGLFNGEESSVAGASEEAVKAVEATKTNEQVAEVTEENVSFFQRIVDALTGLFDKIRGIVIPPEVTAFLTALGDFFKGIFNILTTWFQSAGNIMNGKGDVSDWITLIIPGIILGVVKILDMIDNAHLANINGAQNFAQKFIEIAGGLFLMSLSVAILTTIDQDKMWSAVGAIAVMGAVVGAIIVALEKLTSAKTQNAAVTSKERILTNLIDNIGKIGMIATVMALLPNVIKAIGEAKAAMKGNSDLGGDVMNIMMGVTSLIAGVSLVAAVTQKLTGGAGIDPVAAIKTTVAVVAMVAIAIGAMSGVIALTNLLVGDDVDGTIDAINNAAAVLGAIGGAIGQFFAGLFGGGTQEQKVNESERAMKKLDEMAQVFDEEKVAGINRMIRLMESVADTAANVNITTMGAFGDYMGKFGKGLYDIATWLSEVDGPLADISDSSSDMYKRLYNFMGFGRMLGELMSSFKGLNLGEVTNELERFVSGTDGSLDDDFGFTYGKNNSASKLERWLDAMEKVMKRLGEEEWTKDSGIQFDGLNIAKKLFDAIQEGLVNPSMPKFDATPISMAILESLKLEDKAIAEVVHNMVQNGMILSSSSQGEGGYEIDQSGVEALNTILNNNGNLNGLIDMNSIEKQLYGEGGLLSSFTSLSDKLPSLSSVFSEKGWLDFTDENGNQIDILGEVQTHLTELGDTLSTMEPLKITITPVFDYSNLTPAAIQEGLRNRPIALSGGVNNQKIVISYDGLSSELGMSQIKELLNDLIGSVKNCSANEVAQINSLSMHMDGIADEVSRLKLMLDTGVLAGELTPLIDQNLYMRGLFGRR